MSVPVVPIAYVDEMADFFESLKVSYLCKPERETLMIVGTMTECLARGAADLSKLTSVVDSFEWTEACS